MLLVWREEGIGPAVVSLERKELALDEMQCGSEKGRRRGRLSSSLAVRIAITRALAARQREGGRAAG